MSLEQYKDASRKELWDILQIQMQVLQAETAKVAELEKERDGLALTFKREFTALCSMYIKLSNNVLSGEYANNTPEGSIYNEKIWID